jgi:hypothetical protein
MSLFSKRKWKIETYNDWNSFKKAWKVLYQVYRNDGLIFEDWNYQDMFDTLEEAEKYVSVKKKQEIREVVKYYE